MTLLEKILNKVLLEESVSPKDVEAAIDNHNRVIINYHSKGQNNNTGARVVEVYAYGLTSAGNPVIRAFQPYGDTTSRVPSWKFFRLDRISAWKPTKQIFSRPADFYYKGLGEFNPNGDETMSVVYKIANFNGNQSTTNFETPDNGPKTKEDVYKTDTEKQMERLRQQLQNPIKLSDIKTKDSFKQIQQQPSTEQGPKTKNDVYKTDTERGLERLRQQLKNPKKIDLSQFDKYKKKDANKPEELAKNNSTDETSVEANVEQEPNAEQPTQNGNDNIYKTDTERGLERLSQQLQNARKIDLSQFDKYNKRRR